MAEKQRKKRLMRLQPANRIQLALMLDYMQEHDEFFHGKVTPTFTQKDKTQHWETLTQKLNSLGDNEGKSAGKWKRTWTDWCYSVKKKAKEIKMQKERGFQTKTLSPLEIEALKMLKKLEKSGKFQIDESDIDMDLPQVEEEESFGSETASIEPVKIEDVLYISEDSNASSYDDIPSASSISSPKPTESSSSVTAYKTAATNIGKAKDNNVTTSRVVNSVYVVATKTIPTALAVKKASSSVMSTCSSVHQKSSSSHQEPPKPPLSAKIKQEVIEEVDISDNAAEPGSSTMHAPAAISQSSTVHLPARDKRKTIIDPSTENSELEHESRPITPKRRNEDTLGDLDFEDCPPLPKRRSEDTLGGLPLTLQNSILERLDTLNRNIETNTCALTILAKAINDSAETNLRAVNHLARSLNTVGNMVSSCMEFLKTKQQ